MRSDITARIEMPRSKSEAERAEWEAKRIDGNARWQKNQERLWRDVLPNLIPDRAIYNKWLKGYMESHGDPSHVYDYPTPQFYRVRSPFTLFALYGAQAISVVAPVGINIEIEGMGHNNVFYMDGFRPLGTWVPMYADFVA